MGEEDLGTEVGGFCAWEVLVKGKGHEGGVWAGEDVAAEAFGEFDEADATTDLGVPRAARMRLVERMLWQSPRKARSRMGTWRS